MSRKQYVFTEKDRETLLSELELEKFKAPSNQFIREDATAEQIAEAMHRRFHLIVCRAFDA